VADAVDDARQGGAIIAIIPLTPFVTADGTGFLAPAGVTTTFTSAPPLNVAVTVPAGVFAVPTLVPLTAAPPSDFASIPNLASELHLNGGVRVDFEGIAQKPLELSIPAPAGASSATQYFLGMLGHSTRGPRIEIVDTLRLDGGKFTTTLDPSAATVHLNSLGAHAQSTFPTPGDVKKILARVTRPAAYTSIDMSLGVGWAVVSGAAEGAELFWDSIQSLFVSSYTLSRNVGRALIPVAANRPFTVVGVDASTGLQAFTKVYAGFAPGDPAGAVVLDPANDNDTGPIPVFTSPARGWRRPFVRPQSQNHVRERLRHDRGRHACPVSKDDGRCVQSGPRRVPACSRHQYRTGEHPRTDRRSFDHHVR
jgi:hypothetical protein